jgi:hypothetical protein
MFGKTTNSFTKNLGWARRAIVSFSYAPLDAIMGLSLVVVAFASLGLALQLTLRLVAPASAPKGFTTLIAVILFIGGIQLLCTAIIGSYLAHMYEEVKGRPPFVIDSVLNPPAGAVFPDQVTVSNGAGSTPSERLEDPVRLVGNRRSDR